MNSSGQQNTRSGPVAKRDLPRREEGRQKENAKGHKRNRGAERLLSPFRWPLSLVLLLLLLIHIFSP
ncbi:MAG: hypothetical protein D6679_08545 [Candidatus Hydrogenedentota bacterium]|nr:MAG: hypothetical protein D6679_08545 [Candidatus Hydrogenedentota bacterium]